MAKKNIAAALIDNLRDNFSRANTKLKSYLPKSDRRTVSTTKKAAKELEEKYTPAEIAESLGISRQKWTATKKKIEKGEAYGPDLRDLLRETKEQIAESSPFQEYISGEITLKKEGKRKVESNVWVIEKNWADNNIPYYEKARPKPFASKKSAANWFLGTGGSEYFAIMKIKKGEKMYWYVIDIRTPGEKNRKGSLSKGTKAEKQLQKYQ